MDDAILSLVDKYNGYGIALFTLITIFVAGVLSSFFGLERELRGQSAGLRTHVLLSVGSSLMMTISIYAIRADGVEFDAARIGAAVVGGIGFIGAGCIFKIGFNVKGLTTGATLWMCGGIGLACGSGFVLEAIIATVIALFFLIGLVYVEKIIDKRAPQVKIFCKSDIPILSLIHQKADENNLIIKNIDSESTVDKDGNKIIIVSIYFAYKSNKIAVDTFCEYFKIHEELVSVSYSKFKKDR